MKKSVQEYARDTAEIALCARRFAHASNQLPVWEATKAWDEFEAACKNFASKYQTDADFVRQLAIFGSEVLNLGVNY